MSDTEIRIGGKTQAEWDAESARIKQIAQETGKRIEAWAKFVTYSSIGNSLAIVALWAYVLSLRCS